MTQHVTCRSLSVACVLVGKGGGGGGISCAMEGSGPLPKAMLDPGLMERSQKILLIRFKQRSCLDQE